MNPVNCRLLNFFKPACRVLFFIISAVIGVWCVGVACWMWHFPVWAWTAFAFALTGLLVSSPWIPEAKWMLLIVEISVMASFFLTTPERAFANTKLKSVAIKDSTLYIDENYGDTIIAPINYGEEAFADCKLLEEYSIDADVTKLPKGIFKNCELLTESAKILETKIRHPRCLQK